MFAKKKNKQKKKRKEKKGALTISISKPEESTKLCVILNYLTKRKKEEV